MVATDLDYNAFLAPLRRQDAVSSSRMKDAISTIEHLIRAANQQLLPFARAAR